MHKDFTWLVETAGLTEKQAARIVLEEREMREQMDERKALAEVAERTQKARTTSAGSKAALDEARKLLDALVKRLEPYIGEV